MAIQRVAPGFWEGGTGLTFSLDTGTYNVSTPTGGASIMFLRGPSGQLFDAATGSGIGSATASRYDDNFPEVGEGSVTIEASGATSSCLSVRGSGILDYLYCHTGGAVKMRTSRDQGRTYSGAVTLFASGYTKISTWQDDAGGMLAAMLWKESDTSWYVTVGTLDEAGSAWSFSPPQLAASSALGARGQLRRVTIRGSGRWLFAYVTAGGAVRLLECRSLAADGTGTWSTLVATIASGYEIVTFWLDDRDGMLVIWLYDDGAKKWYLTVGALDAAGTTWSFTTPAFLFDGEDSEGDIIRDPAGHWRATYFATSGALTTKRARNLAGDGTGSWV